MRFELRHNGDVVVHQVEAVARLIHRPSELLEDLGEHMVNTSVPETFRAGGRPTAWPRSTWQAKAPQQESGALLRSVTHELAGGGRTLRVGSNLRYARQRQLGGEIKPTRARALAIPLPGMPASMRRPRRWGGRLFYLPSQAGKPDTVGVLASKDGRGVVTPRFVLRARVEQPARPFLVFQDEDIHWLYGRLAAHLQEAVRG